MTNLPKLRDGSMWVNGGIVCTTRIGELGIRESGEPFIETENGEYAYASDVLALLDANNLNTTANELREKIRIALSRLEVCQRKDAMDLLSEALLISHD